jgi:hypothetical protein
MLSTLHLPQRPQLYVNLHLCQYMHLTYVSFFIFEVLSSALYQLFLSGAMVHHLSNIPCTMNQDLIATALPLATYGFQIRYFLLN